MANSGRSRPANRNTERPVRRSGATPPGEQRPARKSQSARKRKRGGGIFLRLVTMFIIVAVFILGVAIFFKVTDIVVQGNSLYAAEDVIQASGIEKGDNLMTMNKASAAGKIMAVLPYVEQVHISRVLPGTVVLDIRESDAAYAVQAEDGTSWLINSSGKVLEQASTSAAEYPKLTGVTAQSPAPGSQIVTEQTENLAAAKEVLEQLENTEYLAQITEINVEKPYDIILEYGTQYEIRLGGSDEMAYKIQYLSSVIKQLDNSQGGVIDLTFEEEKVARFKPW